MHGCACPCRTFVLAALLLAGGCASLPQDRGFSDVRRLVSDRSGREIERPDAATRILVGELLKKELSPDDAVRIALIQNPRLRATYARLRFASADVYQAGRLSNPRLSASILFSDRAGAASQIGFGIVQSFTDLLLLPSRSRFAKGEFERAKQLAGSAVLDVAAESEAAYYKAVGAQQMATMRRTILTAAQASADLAQRFFNAGNITGLELAMKQAAATQAQIESLAADAEATAARSELNTLLGLSASESQWKLPAGLSAPLPNEDDADALVALAYKSRLDLTAARNEVDLLASALGITRRYRYVGSIEVGVSTERETDRSRITGPTLGLELPIFNQGADRGARAEAQLQQAESDLQVLEIEVGNTVKLAHAKVLSAKRRAEQYRTALIPAARRDCSAHARTGELHAEGAVRAAAGQAAGVRRLPRLFGRGARLLARPRRTGTCRRRTATE